MATGRVPTTANSPLTAKGDLFTYSTAPARLAVGNDGETIVADSSTSTGLKWSANAPLGGLSLLVAATTLSGASTVTLSGFSNKSRLWINIQGASTVNTSTYVGIRFNSDSGTVYGYAGSFSVGGGATQGLAASSDNRFYIGKTSTSAADTFTYFVNVNGAFSSGLVMLSGGGIFNGTSSDTFTTPGGYYFATNQITSVSIISSNGNFDAGTIELWGA